MKARSSKQEVPQEGPLVSPESAAVGAAAVAVAAGGCRCDPWTDPHRSDGHRQQQKTTKRRPGFRPSFPVGKQGDTVGGHNLLLRADGKKEGRRCCRDSRGGQSRGTDGSRATGVAGVKGATAAGGSKGACRGKRTRPWKTAAQNGPTDASMVGTGQSGEEKKYKTKALIKSKKRRITIRFKRGNLCTSSEEAHISIE